MNYRIAPGLLMLLQITALNVQGQIKTRIYKNDLPGARTANAAARARWLTMTPPEHFYRLLDAKDRAEDEYRNKFAMPLPVNINFLKEATRWKENGKAFYSLSIRCPRALNINLRFADFFLSANAHLSIFNDHELTDSITSSQNNPANTWATRVYQGDYLTLLLQVPGEEAEKTRLEINSIGVGFKNVGGSFHGSPGTSASCNINVACDEGNGWENERSSVALIISNSYEICTGTLIMNSCGTDKPYLLTASHCLNSYVGDWVFQFQTWSDDCEPNGDYREDLQFNGCQLRATMPESSTDFALLELNQSPAPNSGLSYSGWTRDTTTTTRTTTLHHPMGDLMKISHDFQAPAKVSYQGGPADHWRTALDQGIIQHGSSGAALFDQNHRVIGQLHGNPLNTCSGADHTCWCVLQVPAIAEFGRFDLSWDGGGTASTRLKDWLDPIGSNPVSTNTTAVANLSSLSSSAYSISGPSQFCTSAEYSIANLPAGASAQWYVNPPSGMINYSVNGNILTVNRNWDGNIVIAATVNICGSSFAYQKNVRVGGDPVYITANELGCSEVQFSVVGAAPGVTHSWSSSGNSILYNGTATNLSTAANPVYAIATDDYAIVNTTSTCNQAVGTSLWYHPFARTIDGLYPEYASCGEHLSVSVNSTQYDSYYRWYVNNTLVHEGSSASSYCSCYFGIDARQSGPNEIRVDVESVCGASSSGYGEFYWYCGSFGYSNIVMFPNPASERLTIRLADRHGEGVGKGLGDIREIRITDKTGTARVVRKFPAGTKTASFDIGHLGMDVYFVEVSDGINKARATLSVQR